jgi:hypothetical protein
MIATLTKHLETKVTYKFPVKECAPQLSTEEIETIATYALDYLQVAKHLPVPEVKKNLTSAIDRQYQHAHLLAIINGQISYFKLSVNLVIEGLLVKLQVAIEIETLKKDN